MKLSSHEIEEGWRLALECPDPVERVLRVRCGIKMGYHTFAVLDCTAALGSVADIMKSSKNHSRSSGAWDSDLLLDWPDRTKIQIERFTQACRDGSQKWPYDSSTGVLPTSIRLSVSEAESGWEIAARTPDPVERAIRVRCGVISGHHAGIPGASIVLSLMIHLIKGSAQEPDHTMSDTAANVEAFVEACRSGIKTWPYGSPVGVMPDWTDEITIGVIMSS